MLVMLLTARYTHFASLAETWLTAGATAFGIWRDDQPLAHWPGDGMLHTPSIVAPIWLGEQIVGDLRVAGIDDPLAHSRLNAEAAMVSDMVQLEDELQRMTEDLVTSRDQLLALYRIMPTAPSSTTLETMFRNLVHETLRIFQAETRFVIFVPANGKTLLFQYPEAAFKEALLLRCFWHARSHDYEGVLISSYLPEELSSDMHNVLFVPLRIQGIVAAGIGLINKPGAGFTAPDIRLARAIASQVSAQVENLLLSRQAAAQLHLQDEMELASRVQTRLLSPELPAVAGLEIAAHCRPALQVGGDFYDFIRHSNRSFIFSVGDVTGKGLSAALLMTMTRATIHSKAAFLPDATPEIIVRKANTELYGHFTQVGMFATVFVGQYQPWNRTLVYANAGHAPVIYRPCDGVPRLLPADSTALGVLNVSLCENQYITLQPGDLLLVATDGFSDARNAESNMFGWDRLLALVNSLAHKAAHEIATGIYHALEQFAFNRSQDDDQTLVVLKGVDT